MKPGDQRLKNKICKSLELQNMAQVTCGRRKFLKLTTLDWLYGSSNENTEILFQSGTQSHKGIKNNNA